MNVTWKAIAPLAVGAAVALCPAPAGLDPQAWYYFALFLAVITGLILEPIPSAAIGFIGVTLATALLMVSPKIGTPATAADGIRFGLSGFSNGTVWLIFAAYMFSLGYEETGLGRRIALHLIRVLGKKTLGLGYAVALADLVVAPFTPSNTARSGGIIFPIIKNIPPLYDSTPEHGQRKIGGYLMWTALATTCVTSTWFLTGVAPNLLAIDMLQKQAKLSVSWMDWFSAMTPACAILFLLVPLLTYLIYPPSVKQSADAPQWARKSLDEMGSITRKEVIMALLALMALTMWIFGTKQFDATTVAMIGISLMVLTGVISWNDVISHKHAWNVLIWFATLVTLADGLRMVGFLAWLAKVAAAAMAGFSVTALIISMVLMFFFIHYLFASLTAHTTALLPVFLATAMSVTGMPMMTFGLLVCGTLGLMGIITPYATGPSPIYYGSGYISRKEFWVLGAVFGVVFVVVYLAVGYPYLSSMAR